MPPSFTTCFLFRDRAEEAMHFYLSVFENGRVIRVMRMPPDGPLPEGSLAACEFELNGTRFMAINGGSYAPAFSDAMSVMVQCDTQAEVDRYWSMLSAGGSESQCGWLRDRFGVSWQITPRVLLALHSDPDPARARRAMQAMLTMRKIDIAALVAAANGP